MEGTPAAALAELPLTRAAKSAKPTPTAISALFSLIGSSPVVVMMAFVVMMPFMVPLVVVMLVVMPPVVAPLHAVRPAAPDFHKAYC
jgi:hypothetical protein